MKIVELGETLKRCYHCGTRVDLEPSDIQIVRTIGCGEVFSSYWVCPMCNSLLEPLETDILGGFADWPYMIACPVCDETIHLNLKKISYIREHTEKITKKIKNEQLI